MGVILLEALLALAVFVFIIWWTMFSGRKRGEPPARDDPQSQAQQPAAGPPDRPH
ncbi:hypothetical protein GCM10022279_08330 [Comamonas faecalis]|uniref:CcoQ/FixQ family Cbb3-type cytochrome c oxidase assembly chaperone n=1 Tax=Comamonas faecalis TaxID=1387849 RepID=A0ABP7QU56_9BURK